MEKARKHPAVRQLLRRLNDPQRSLPGDAQDWQPVVMVGISKDSSPDARSVAYLAGPGSGLHETAERALKECGLSMKDLRICPVCQTVFVAAHGRRVYCTDLCKETARAPRTRKGSRKK